ncbi:ubiquinol-cytochrome C reductase complex core protein 2 [Cyathus striatus]|nr:ubiquinol-cytochrome C reductase complex core protein 2 [Cyathus striatus]
MLAARASASRNVQRIAKRSLATVADATGIKVAAVDHGQPTTAVTLLVKAGSRFQSKEGVAHALKNFSFKSTAKRSALGTIRESELYGGVLSASLSREYLALTAEFLRGDESFFVDVLSSYISSAKFTRHEFEEYVLPLIEGEIDAAATDNAVRAIEAAHTLAFRSGLGASLFAPHHNDLTVGDIKSFAASAFTKGNIAILGSGIEQSALVDVVEQTLAGLPSAAALSTSPTAYFGGETRLDGTGPQTVFIGFGAPGAPSAELAALAAHLSTKPSLKWSKGLSPINAAIPAGTSVESVYLPYTDATLFGLLVQGHSAEAVKEAGKVAVQQLGAAAQGIKEEDVKKAVAKAKYAAAFAAESRDGLVLLLVLSSSLVLICH